MAISPDTLTALQSAGAAAFAAQTELQRSVDAFSEQIKAAVTTNAFDMGNDALFEDWKTLARLAQAVGHIEAELRKVYSIAASMTGARKTRSLLPAGPSIARIPNLPLEMVTSIDATDARIKKTKTKDKRKYTKAASRKTGKARPLVGNTAKLLEHLLKTLSAQEFTKVNRSLLATEVGLPKGSIGASVSKLLETGHIVQDGDGRLKMV